MQAKLILKMDNDAIIDSDIFLEFNKVPSKSNTNNIFPPRPPCGRPSNIVLNRIAAKTMAG